MSMFGNCFQPRSGNKKVARRETSGTVCNRFSALKTQKECLALLQSTKINSTNTRRFTSGYLLTAPSAQILHFQTRSMSLLYWSRYLFIGMLFFVMFCFVTSFFVSVVRNREK
jgi:hypothetical protein